MSADVDGSETSAGTRKRWTEEEGREAVKAWRESGQALARFAREREMAPWRLRWWAQRLEQLQGRRSGTSQTKRRNAESIELIPAVIRPEISMKVHAFLVRMPDGIAVEMRSVEDVVRLVSALRRNGV